MKRMKLMTVVMLWPCLVAGADLDIRELTHDSAKQLGWKIDVHEKQDYVFFTVLLPAELREEDRTAHLSVWDDRTLITSCILGVHKRRLGDRYEFAVSKQYLTDSTFELGRKPAAVEGESYRLRLSRFVSFQQDEADPLPATVIEE